MQNVLRSEVPHTELSSRDNVNAGKIADVRLRVLDRRGAHVREVLPFDRLKPAAVLLFWPLPFRCTYRHVRVPMWLQDFGERD